MATSFLTAVFLASWAAPALLAAPVHPELVDVEVSCRDHRGGSIFKGALRVDWGQVSAIINPPGAQKSEFKLHGYPLAISTIGNVLYGDCTKNRYYATLSQRWLLLQCASGSVEVHKGLWNTGNPTLSPDCLSQP